MNSDAIDKRSRAARDPRLLRICLISAAFAWLLFLAVLIQDGGLLHRNTFGNFYAAQADALNHGQWNVDRHEVGFEGFEVDGKTYLYFGPVPAIVRMPVEAVTSSLHGKLTRLSMLLGEALLLWFVIRLVLLADDALRAKVGHGRLDLVVNGLFVFAVGSSSVLYLAGESWVYHEAILWGAALTIGSLTMLAEYLRTRRATTLVWSGLLAILAFNTRSSSGAGALVALGLFGLVEIIGLLRSKTRLRNAWKTLGVVSGSLLAAVASYMAVNWARFGSLLSIPFDKQMIVQVDKHRQEIFAANNQSMFSLKYVPTQLVQSLRPDAIAWDRLFPFVNFQNQPVRVFGHMPMETRQPLSSITASEFALFAIAVLGLAVLLINLVRRRSTICRGWWILVAGAACSGLGFLFTYYLANRYYTDVLPFLVFTGIIGLGAIRSWFQRNRSISERASTRTAVAGIAVILVFAGAWINASLGLHYHENFASDTTPAARASWLNLQMRIDRSLHGNTPLSGVHKADRLPDVAPRGDLAILAGCQALYRSNGSKWVLLAGDPTVSLQVTGKFDPPRFRTRIVAEKGPEGNVLQIVIRSLPDGKQRFELRRVGASGFKTLSVGPPKKSLGRGVHTLVVTMNPFSNWTRVVDDGQRLFSAKTRIGPDPITAGPSLVGHADSMGLCEEVSAKS